MGQIVNAPPCFAGTEALRSIQNPAGLEDRPHLISQTADNTDFVRRALGYLSIDDTPDYVRFIRTVMERYISREDLD